MESKVKTVKLSEIKLNPENPRTITENAMANLVKSLQEFPDMMSLREIIVDEKMMVLGGNMRLLALQKIGAKVATAKIVKGLTPEQKREFVIKDNAPFGEWDMDALANAWGDLPLIEWGVDLPEWLTRPEDGDKAGSSPWDRVGDTSEGVMFTFGEVQVRLPLSLYQAFEISAPKDKVDLTKWLETKLDEICNS